MKLFGISYAKRQGKLSLLCLCILTSTVASPWEGFIMKQVCVRNNRAKNRGSLQLGKGITFIRRRKLAASRRLHSLAIRHIWTSPDPKSRTAFAMTKTESEAHECPVWNFISQIIGTGLVINGHSKESNYSPRNSTHLDAFARKVVPWRQVSLIYQYSFEMVKFMPCRLLAEIPPLGHAHGMSNEWNLVPNELDIGYGTCLRWARCFSGAKTFQAWAWTGSERTSGRCRSYQLSTARIPREHYLNTYPINWNGRIASCNPQLWISTFTSNAESTSCISAIPHRLPSDTCETCETQSSHPMYLYAHIYYW